MATKTQWSKTGLKLVCDVSSTPVPEPKQVYAIPVIPVDAAPLITVTLETLSDSRNGIRVAPTCIPLPAVEAEEWSLWWKWAGAATWSSRAVDAAGFSFLLEQPNPNTTYQFRLQRTCGAQVYDYPTASITTNADPVVTLLVPIEQSITAVQEVADDAAATANAAQAAANTASAGISAINSDDILSRAKKPQLISDYNAEWQIQTKLGVQSNALGITTDKLAYEAKVTALTSFLNGLSPSWSDTAQDTPLGTGGGQTLRAKWADIATYRTALQTAISGAQSNNAQAAAIASAATTAMQKAAYTTDGVMLDGRTLAGGSITAATMANSNSTNLIPNPNSEATAPAGGWPIGAWEAVALNLSDVNAYSGNNDRILGPSGFASLTPNIPTVEGEQFYFEAQAKANSGGAAKILIIPKDKTGTPISYPASSVNSAFSYSKLSFNATMPAGTCSVVFAIQNNTASGYCWFDNLYAGKVLVSGMIGANAVVAGTVAAQAITAKNLIVANFDNLFTNPNGVPPYAGYSSSRNYDHDRWAVTDAGSPNGYSHLLNATAQGHEIGVGFHQDEGTALQVCGGERYYMTARFNGGGGIYWFATKKTGEVTGSGLVVGAASWAVTPLTLRVPDNSAKLNIYAFCGSGACTVTDLYLRRMADSNLIVDGTFTALFQRFGNDLQSTNYSPGSSSAACTGLRLSSAPYNAYEIGNPNPIPVQGEVGSNLIVAGYKAATLADQVFNRSISYSTPGTYTWVAPQGCKYVRAVVCGAGGGGGGAYTTTYGGGGGGGGSAISVDIPVVPGNSYSIIVGAGGLGGVTSADGGDGGDSSISGINGETGIALAIQKGKGGKGGKKGTSTAYGAGGNGGAIGSTVTINGGIGSATAGTVGGSGGSASYISSASTACAGGGGGCNSDGGASVDCLGGVLISGPAGAGRGGASPLGIGQGHVSNGQISIGPGSGGYGMRVGYQAGDGGPGFVSLRW